MRVGGLDEDLIRVVSRVLGGQGAQHALRSGGMRAIDARAALCVYVKVWARGTRLRVLDGGLGENVVHVAKRVLDDQGAQHALREGELRAIDDRAALCVC